VIDREAVPPATSPWTVVITAAAAFLGVVVAQWWTGRRENRNWQRQREMYAQQWEDQRERDGEQREDQRQRDRELWEREDRHRFTNDKRQIYAEFLTAADSTTDEWLTALRLLQAEVNRRQRAGEEQILDLHEWCRDNGIAASLRQSWGELDRLASLIALIAPAPVVEKSIDLIGGVHAAETFLFKEQNIEKVLYCVSTLPPIKANARRAMRLDLGLKEF
jgi:hypothetical protein